MKRLQALPLLPLNDVTALIEQKRGFNLNVCELNIYETRKEITDLPLSFNGFTITSMLRGRKQVRFSDLIDREYLPGNTIITPSFSKLKIDFPKASFENPTQCSALTLDNNFVRNKINEFNEFLTESVFIESWRILDNPVLLYNNQELVDLHKRIMDIAASNDAFKEVHIQLLLKEMVLCVLKMQNVSVLKDSAKQNTNNAPFEAILNFIKQNIFQEIKINDLLKISCMSKSSFYRAFVEELGVSPYQLIIDEKLLVAKQMMKEEKLSVKETAYAMGFSSANYFIRLFKKHEGLTPKQFVKQSEN